MIIAVLLAVLAKNETINVRQNADLPQKVEHYKI